VGAKYAKTYNMNKFFLKQHYLPLTGQSSHAIFGFICLQASQNQGSVEHEESLPLDPLNVSLTP